MSEARKAILTLVGSATPIPLAATPAGWPEGLCLRRPTLTERDEIASYLTSGPDGKHPSDSRAFLLVRLVCTPDGHRIFADDDATAVGALPADDAYSTITNQALGLFGADEGDDPNP